MSETKSVEINVSPTGTGTLLLDGDDLSNTVAGFDLHARVGDVTTLTLKLPLRGPGQFAGDARVVVDDFTASLLKAIGWTPPDGES